LHGAHGGFKHTTWPTFPTGVGRDGNADNRDEDHRPPDSPQARTFLYVLCNRMNTYSMKFDGALLARGFWLYVWHVTAPSRAVVYVGRTGDSSSRNASSPFRRIGQHLDVRSTAKANALRKQLALAGIEPEECAFEMVAFGPIFPEQGEMEAHRAVRDGIAALERALADFLRGRGYEVLGAHPKAKPFDSDLFSQIQGHLSERFPVVARL
jgi:hypothetical protein